MKEDEGRQTKIKHICHTVLATSQGEVGWRIQSLRAFRRARAVGLRALGQGTSRNMAWDLVSKEGGVPPPGTLPEFETDDFRA